MKFVVESKNAGPFFIISISILVVAVGANVASTWRAYDHTEHMIETEKELILELSQPRQPTRRIPGQQEPIPRESEIFNESQADLMRRAYEIGHDFGFPETLQAILYQETHAGEYGNRIGDRHERVGKRSYGIMQIKTGTVRFTFKHRPELKEIYFGDRAPSKIMDEELIVLLMTDDEASIVIAAHHFETLLGLTDSWSRAVAAYNGGLGLARKLKDPKNFKYVKEVNKHIKSKIRPFNNELGLTKEKSNDSTKQPNRSSKAQVNLGGGNAQPSAN